MENMDESSNCAMLDLYDDLITDDSVKKQEDFQQVHVNMILEKKTNCLLHYICIDGIPVLLLRRLLWS